MQNAKKGIFFYVFFTKLINRTKTGALYHSFGYDISSAVLIKITVR